MHATRERAKARREIVVSVALLAATLVVLVLALRGTFNSMWFFPHIFGGIVAAFAIVSLFTARTVLWKPRLLLALAIVAVAAVTPALHVRAVHKMLEAYERRAEQALRGKPAPPVPFVRSIGVGDGRAGSLEPGGRLTLLNFWATWCDPCVEELPMLEKFWNDHRASGVEVIGVTRLYDGPEGDEEIRKIEAFLGEYGVTYPVVIGDEISPAHEAYGATTMPSSVLIDRDGSVIGFGAGIRGTKRLMREIEDRLGRPER